jgi:hypothetical protein
VPAVPGTLIGRYKLLEPIGEGGHGTVFMAEQTSPVQRKVALKIIKAGMDTRQVIARFEAERQALALMDHPNIAKVFDAGMTDTGRPYFVMELVKGMPITKYCDAHHIEPRQRLELFMQVCQAVQHAHQKGIIHRDLKPSNVLVAQYDGKPVPKVIDFGVAKATGQSLTDLTMFTGFGDVIGTLEYMSPEQAEVNQLDVDTRSDIYSLGVLLYELLTGSTPLEHKRVLKAGLLEMLRVVREEEPQRPSTRLTTTAELPSIAANRGLEPKKLSGLVHGELDWIVMKALEKDRSRRYETANGFASDVQRYLSDEAVHACPPSASYRLRKFTRRHHVPIAVAAVFLCFLAAGTVVSTYQAIRIRAEQANTLAQKGVAEQEREAARNSERVAQQQLAATKIQERLNRLQLARSTARAGDFPAALTWVQGVSPDPETDQDRWFAAWEARRASREVLHVSLAAGMPPETGRFLIRGRVEPASRRVVLSTTFGARQTRRELEWMTGGLLRDPIDEPAADNDARSGDGFRLRVARPRGPGSVELLGPDGNVMSAFAFDDDDDVSTVALSDDARFAAVGRASGPIHVFSIVGYKLEPLTRITGYRETPIALGFEDGQGTSSGKAGVPAPETTATGATAPAADGGPIGSLPKLHAVTADYTHRAWSLEPTGRPDHSRCAWGNDAPLRVSSGWWSPCQRWI